jgi:hypothetical protein
VSSSSSSLGQADKVNVVFLSKKNVKKKCRRRKKNGKNVFERFMSEKF